MEQPSMQHSFKDDILSGFIVFLIALPLSLGIAVASGFPPIAGILAATIGGIIGSLTKARLVIKGPAAGLIVIALGCVQELGGGDFQKGYVLTLGVIVIASLVQIIFGFIKLGTLSSYFPREVIHGMMASIGLIIIIKQIYPLLGILVPSMNIYESIAILPHELIHINPEITLIGILSLIILIIYPKLNVSFLQKIPAPVWVVGFAISLSLIFNLEVKHSYEIFHDYVYTVGPEFLVNLPDNFLSGITFPDFSAIVTISGIKYILLFSLIGSIESLLTIKAMNQIDPLKIQTNPNKELIVLGITNAISGFLGGLPIISEVVRSSANFNNGGRTWLANFSHGIFLLVFVVFFPKIIHLIPLAALSAILIFTGFKLASPRVFIESFEEGYAHFLPFLITILLTLLEDLLIGVLSGTLLHFLLLKFNSKNPKEHKTHSNG